MTKAWVVRAGRRGENEQFNLEHGVATVGWDAVGDLTSCTTREDVRALVAEAYPADSPGKQANSTGQLWAFRDSIKSGDLVVMPSKLQPGYLRLGRCTGPFRYVSAELDKSRRKQLPVDWATELVSRSAIKDDLLNSLGAISTLFNPTRNNAAARLEQVAKTGVDPGRSLLSATATKRTKPDSDLANDAEQGVVDPDVAPTAEAIRDRVRTHLVENFSGHKMTHLVAEILEALGFICEVSPAGPDGGVDIIAGRGPLGLDAPTLIVEVKSEPTPIDVKVFRGLHSAMTQHRADQGLLVAWGGVKSSVMREFARDRTSLRIWDAETLLDKFFKTYDELSSATKAAPPLKQVWVLDVDE